MNGMIWHGMLILMVVLGAIVYFTAVLFGAFRIKNGWLKTSAWLMYLYTMYVITLYL